MTQEPNPTSNYFMASHLKLLFSCFPDVTTGHSSLLTDVTRPASLRGLAAATGRPCQPVLLLVLWRLWTLASPD